jgi:hypothetical protein
MVGDPIFVDSARPELPVYTAAHGQGLWIADLIADSLSSFILSLAAFNAVTENRTYPVQLDKNPLSDTERIATLERIRLLNKLDDYTFWENLLVTNWA